jgi:hypothetical protein
VNSVETIWKSVSRRLLIEVGGSWLEIGTPAKQIANIQAVQPLLDAHSEVRNYLHNSWCQITPKSTKIMMRYFYNHIVLEFRILIVNYSRIIK